MIPSTIGSLESQQLDAEPPQLRLRWLFPDATRRPVPLLGGFQIGRDPECLLLIEGEGVSRRHAQVVEQNGGFVLRDLGSRNGTFLDGQRIDEAPISAGALLRIGEWLGVFEERSGAPGAGFEELGPGLWGGPQLRAALAPARAAALTNLPIVLVGETGTGKEVVARAIHAWSGRAGPFAAINCAALPGHLVEGELFGYRRGAFTGAERSNLGHFRAAHGGTLLLDEVTELELPTQAKLLRVLQEQELVPLGESAPVRIDVRIVVAAQAPLDGAVAAGRFRADLHMRVAGLSVVLPPLRTRRGDVAALFQHFVQRHASGAPPSVEARLLEALCLAAWPGNVRELELSARRLLAVHAGEPVLKRRFLQSEALAAEPPVRTQRDQDLEDFAAALRKHAGNVTRACAELGITRSRGYRLLDGLSVESFLAKYAGR